MTPKEAINTLKNHTQYYVPTSDLEALDMAIKALKEIHQYREIGTVAECREAVEKQKAERIEYETDAVFSNGFSHYRIGKCPICDNRYNSNDEIDYCSN